MKYLLLVIFSFITNIIFAQWTVQNPHPTGNNLYIGSAPSADRYIVVSQQGEAVVTHDGGTTWSVIQIGGDGIYRSCYFINDNVGWAVGSFVERLHKTTDGGLTWIWQPNAPDTTKYDVFFIDENTGWSVGFNGFIIKTTDGGSNWFSQTNTSVTSSTLYGVAASDANNIHVAGNANSLLRSTDGGNTWSMHPPVFGTSTDYRSVYFPPTGTGFLGFAVGSRNRIIKTTDGGANWLPAYDGGVTNHLWAIDFDSSNLIGLACGANGTVLRTTDGGTTWNIVGGLPSTIFYSVRFGADNAAYLSGNSGYLFKSTDGGATWTELSYRFTTQRIRDVSFSDNLNGYVVGTGMVARTTNGGTTWTLQNSPYSGDINEVVSTSPDFAIAGCDGGNVLRTTDGGVNWTQIATGITGTNSDILAIDFINNNEGLIAAYNGTVAKTTDGGLTWSILSSIVGTNPWDMDMVDNQYAWVSGTGERIFRTTDGGVNWTQQLAAGGLGTYGISFIDRNTGVAGGTSGNTYYTTNGGNTWNPAITPPGNTVWGIHIAPSPVYGSVALTACASAYVYLSTDGGMNWIQQPRFSISTMDDVWMTDAANAWFVGNSGLILNYFEPANIPVELAGFTASVSGNNITLDWTTASELNNSGFEIERSVFIEKSGESSEWEKIDFVEGKGTTTEISFYSYIDKKLEQGNYNYRLKQIDFDGSFRYYYLNESITISFPEYFELMQNFPNPFNPVTNIRYQVAEKQFISLKISDVLGNEVAVLVNEIKDAGTHNVEFNADKFSSGVYYYTLTAGNFKSTKKMILLK